MGRGKIEIKRIENLNSRLVTYTKRRTGLLKKAKEIAVLCDARLSLVIFAPSGRMHEYCNPSNQYVCLFICPNFNFVFLKRVFDFTSEV